MSVPSDSAVCHTCGRVGRRENYARMQDVSGFDAFRCPECGTPLAGETES